MNKSKHVNKNKLKCVSEVSSIIKNFALVISLIIGGYWGYKTYIFQNPAFYKTGSLIMGQDPKSINGEIEVNLLSEKQKLYEIELIIKNFSETNKQLLNYDRLNLFFQRIGSTEKEKVEFKSLLQVNEGIWIPKGQSRKLKFLAEFPEPGTYLIEANLCEKFHVDCIFQKYIYLSRQQNKNE